MPRPDDCVEREYSRGRHTASAMLIKASAARIQSPPHSVRKTCANCAGSPRPDTARAESSAACRALDPTVSKVPSKVPMPSRASVSYTHLPCFAGIHPMALLCYQPQAHSTTSNSLGLRQSCKSRGLAGAKAPEYVTWANAEPIDSSVRTR